MASIPMGKMRNVGEPYLVFERGSWRYEVLKAYSADPDKPYARWFCAVSSIFTQGGFDMGDTYITEVIKNSALTYRDPSVPDSAIPQAVR